MSSGHGLHRAVGGIETRWREAMKGQCAVHSDRPAVAAVAGWNHAQPKGACGPCARFGAEHGYHVEWAGQEAGERG